MKKKILLTLAIISVFICLFAISVSAIEIDGIHYTLKSDGTAIVNTSNRQGCTLKVVDIPEIVLDANKNRYTVTEISGEAFRDNTYIEEVIVPATVGKMGTHCFRNCTKLKKITVYAAGGDFTFTNAEFYGCSNLKIADFSQATGLKSIDAYAFNLCSSLEEVYLPEGLTKISSNAFQGLSKLAVIKFPSTLKEISGKQTFGGGNYTSVYLPKGIVYLGNNVFQASKLKSIVIPSTVTTIGEHCFNNTKSLKYAVIANPNVSNYNTLMFYESAIDVIFYAGDKSQANDLATYFSTNNGKIKFTNVISYDEYLKNPNVNAYTKTIVYGTRNCDVCSNILTNQTSFKFTSFTEKMHDANHCTHCGEIFENSTTYAPILTFSGYSAKIDGDEICVGYTINYDSLRIYEQKTGKQPGTVKFGITASLVGSAMAKYETINNDLSVMNGAVAALVNSDCPAFDFVLTDFTADYYNIPLVMCAFVSDGTDIYYASYNGCTTLAAPITFAKVVGEDE